MSNHGCLQDGLPLLLWGTRGTICSNQCCCCLVSFERWRCVTSSHQFTAFIISQRGDHHLVAAVLGTALRDDGDDRAPPPRVGGVMRAGFGRVVLSCLMGLLLLLRGFRRRRQEIAAAFSPLSFLLFVLVLFRQLDLGCLQLLTDLCSSRSAHPSFCFGSGHHHVRENAWQRKNHACNRRSNPTHGTSYCNMRKTLETKKHAQITAPHTSPRKTRDTAKKHHKTTRKGYEIGLCRRDHHDGTNRAQPVEVVSNSEWRHEEIFTFCASMRASRASSSLRTFSALARLADFSASCRAVRPRSRLARKTPAGPL